MYWRRRGWTISKFWVISLFQHRCSTRAGKQQFHWRKRIAIPPNFIEETQTTIVNSLKRWVWNRWLQTTEGNDLTLGRIINAPTWADLNVLLQKKLTSKVYSTKRSSTEWLISSILRDKEMFVPSRAPEKGGKMKWRACPTTNHITEGTNRFSTGILKLKRRHGVQ